MRGTSSASTEETVWGTKLTIWSKILPSQPKPDWSEVGLLLSSLPYDVSHAYKGWDLPPFLWSSTVLCLPRMEVNYTHFQVNPLRRLAASPDSLLEALVLTEVALEPEEAVHAYNYNNGKAEAGELVSAQV